MSRPQPPAPTVVAVSRAWIGFSLLLFAHFAVRPLIKGPAHVDFVIIAILFSAARMRPGLAAAMGFLTGLAVDAMAPSSFGAVALALTLVAFGASRWKAAIFVDHVVPTGLFVFGGKWLFDAALVLLAGAASGASTGATLLLWSPLSALLTAFTAVFLLTALRPLYKLQGL